MKIRYEASLIALMVKKSVPYDVMEGSYMDLLIKAGTAQISELWDTFNIYLDTGQVCNFDNKYYATLRPHFTFIGD